MVRFWLGVPMPCIHCEEKIFEGDLAVIYGVNTPAHRECAQRRVIGSVAHLERRCCCYIAGSDCNDDPSLTRRQAALAACAAWEKLVRSPNALDEDE